MTTDVLSTPSERLKIICETYYGGNKSKMGKALDVSYQNINNYIEKGKKPSFEVIQKVYEAFQDRLNPAWLLLGEGDMFLEGIPHAHATVRRSAPSTNINLDELTLNSDSTPQQILDYQTMIIELQQRVIKQLER